MFSKPAVGTTITVTTKYRDGNYYSTNEWKHFTYKNVPVVPSQKYDGPNTFRIPADRDSSINERVIDLANVERLVIDGELASTVATKNDPNKITVITVKGSKNNEYVVKLVGGKPVSCTCPQNAYRRAVCKHMISAQVPNTISKLQGC